MDWQTRRDQAVGFAVIAFAAVLGVFAGGSLLVGAAVLMDRIAEVAR